MRLFGIEIRPLTWVLLFALLSAAMIAFATPSVAGTVYRWTTDDGTIAFTDDPKRIPARYKEEAERQETGSLKNYSRLTIAETTTKTPYEERINARLESLRRAETPAVSAGPPSAEHPTALNIGIGENDQLSIPLEGGSKEPLQVDSYRVHLPENARVGTNIGTQNATVTRRGDEVVSVTVSPRTSRPVSEKGFVGAKEIGAD